MSEPARQVGPEGRPQELNLNLPAAHSAARMARHLIQQFALSAGIEGQELDIMVLVADELLTNAVDHGGGGAAMEVEELEGLARMRMLLVLNPKGWEISVSDQGGGDVEELRRVIGEEGLPDLDDERGRGFFLLAQMVRMKVRASEDGLGLCVTAVREYGAPS